MPSSNPPPSLSVRTASYGPVLFGCAIGAAFYFLALILLNLPFGPEGWLVPKEPASRYANGYWIGRVLSSWVNLFSLMAFAAAMCLLWSRWRGLRRQRSGFGIGMLDEQEGTLLLASDGLELRKRLRQLSEEDRSLALVHILEAGLQRARADWSASEVGEAIKTQAELLHTQIESDYATIRYLAWAIPSIGFIGTVLGIGEAMGQLNANPDEGDPLKAAAASLSMAFDTTFVALALSLVLMWFVYRIQADEDDFFNRATEWCMRNFVRRMHSPKGTEL